MTPRQAAAKATRMIKESEILYDQAHNLIDGTAIGIAPVVIGSIISQRDDCNRLRYFRVQRIKGTASGKVVRWYADAFRCTRSGAKRGGTVRFNADSRFEILPLEAHGDPNG